MEVSDDLSIVRFTRRHIREALPLRVQTMASHQALHPHVFSSTAYETNAWRELEACCPRLLSARKQKNFGLAAVEDNQLRGYLLYALHPQAGTMFRHARAATVLDIAVSDGVRRNGLGKALLKKFIEEARARSVAVFYAVVWEGNDASSALFKRSGFSSVCQTYSMNAE